MFRLSLHDLADSARPCEGMARAHPDGNRPAHAASGNSQPALRELKPAVSFSSPVRELSLAIQCQHVCGESERFRRQLQGLLQTEIAQKQVLLHHQV